MSRPVRVYRVDVTYPTADGRPFVDQPVEFWEQAVDWYCNPGDQEMPEWLPDFGGHMYSDDGFGDLPDIGTTIFSNGRPLLTVPNLRGRRHWLGRPSERIAKLREWGCTVILSTADVTDEMWRADS